MVAEKPSFLPPRYTIRIRAENSERIRTQF